MTKDSLTRSVAILGVGGALLVAGCSTTTTSSPGAPASKTKTTAPSTPKSTSSAEIPCAQVKKLRTSLTDLTKTGINPTSASKLTTELKDIQTELASLKNQAHGMFATQVGDLKTTITKISTDAKGLSSNPGTAIQKLTSDLSKLRSTAAPVITEINAACPK